MLVYRISLTHRAKSLSGSGYPARWNSKGSFLIYTAASRALACLENIVHRSGEGLSLNFKILTIEIPDEISISEIKPSQLRKDWTEYQNYIFSQKIGDEWLKTGITAVLKIPSAIIPEESNLLLNPAHPQFKKIKIIEVDDFIFDNRIKL